MSHRTPFVSLHAIALLIGLSACHRTAGPAVEDTAGRVPAAGHAVALPNRSAGGAGSTGGCGFAPVYFGFDSDALDEPSRAALEQSRRCLDERSIREVDVTGMADPRGTEEYNLALGERRARTVAGYLGRLGVGDVRVHSLGEETATGHDDGGWARDRRAEIEPR